MRIDAEHYRDGLAIKGLYTETAWVRKSMGGTYVLQVGNGVLTLLDASELVSLGETLVKYGKERHAADCMHTLAVMAGTQGA